MNDPLASPIGNGPRPHPGVAALTAYRRTAMPAAVDLRLDGNEGALPDAGLVQTLLAADPDVLRCYPATAALEAEIATRHGVAADQVLVTAGGDEALDRVFRAFTTPGRRVVLPEPSFEMLPRYAALAGAEIVAPAWPAGPFPTDAVVACAHLDPAVVLVVTPNNPTGAFATAADLETVARAMPNALIVLDHAYAEFTAYDLTAVALSLPNVVVVRTLSKAFGLAGLRIGWLLGDAATIETLRKAGSPYTVAGPSVAIARAALATAPAAVAGFVARVRDERVGLVERLLAHGVAALPSEGNFVLARGARVRWLVDGLRAHGIAIRSFAGRPGLDDAARITCPGAAEPFARLMRAIDVVFAPAALCVAEDLTAVATPLPTLRVARASDGGLASVDLLRAHGVDRGWLLTARPDDVDAARAAGLLPIGVGDPVDPRWAAAAVAAVLPNPAAVLDLLNVNAIR